MLTTLDILNSTLTSTLRFWRGTNARPAAEQPAKLLELYELEACPYCRLVREVFTELDLDALIFPTPHGGKHFRPKIEKLGGRHQFPYLVDPITGTALFESEAIRVYLLDTYAR